MQLSNGLYVSGHPEQYKEKAVLVSSAAAPYTGGDVKKSGELGKMFDIPVENANVKRKSGPISGGIPKPSSSGNAGASSHSGPLRTAFSTSGPLSSAGMARQNSLGSKSGPIAAGRPKSGPMPKPSDPSLKTSGPLNPPPLPTGLITSGPISGPLSSSTTIHKLSGPLSHSSAPAIGPVKRAPPSGPIDSSSHKPSGTSSSSGSHAVNILTHQRPATFKNSFPNLILLTVVVLFVLGFVVGAYFVVSVHSPILLIVVAALFLLLLLLWSWNSCWAQPAVTRYLLNYPDAELAKAQDGHYVKVTGVVTCGSVPLESSYQRVNRCIYTSTGLYEYKGFMSKPANDKHRLFTWGLRRLERHVVDFYISDFQTGLRALVKAGYGSAVTPYVQESTIVDVSAQNKDLPTDFVRWLGERNLSSDDRTMQLREGYIKEGSTVTVLGVVHRQDNVLMIVPPPESVPTGCQLGLCLLPANLEGIVLKSDEVARVDGIPL